MNTLAKLAIILAPIILEEIISFYLKYQQEKEKETSNDNGDDVPST